MPTSIFVSYLIGCFLWAARRLRAQRDGRKPCTHVHSPLFSVCKGFPNLLLLMNFSRTVENIEKILAFKSWKQIVWLEYKRSTLSANYHSVLNLAQ